MSESKTDQLLTMPDPETAAAAAAAIVRALAATDPMFFGHDLDPECVFCGGIDATRAGTHKPICPWRRAVEWCAAHPLPSPEAAVDPDIEPPLYDDGPGDDDLGRVGTMTQRISTPYGVSCSINLPDPGDDAALYGQVAARIAGYLTGLSDLTAESALSPSRTPNSRFEALLGSPSTIYRTHQIEPTVLLKELDDGPGDSAGMVGVSGR